MSELPFTHAEAVRRYARLAEGPSRGRSGEDRIDATRAMEKAREALEPAERAILDLVAVRGRTLAGLSRETGRSLLSLTATMHRAARKLADHFESVGVDHG